MKIEILVAAHKKFPMPEVEGYLPVLVGAKRIISQIFLIKEMMKEKIYLQRIQTIMN